MKKNIFFVCCAAMLIAVPGGISLSQQEPARSPDPELVGITARLDRMEQAQKQIDRKIDTVIANQQKILAELDIVKIRATRK